MSPTGSEWQAWTAVAKETSVQLGNLRRAIPDSQRHPLLSKSPRYNHSYRNIKQTQKIWPFMLLSFMIFRQLTQYTSPGSLPPKHQERFRNIPCTWRWRRLEETPLRNREIRPSYAFTAAPKPRVRWTLRIWVTHTSTAHLVLPSCSASLPRTNVATGPPLRSAGYKVCTRVCGKCTTLFLMQCFWLYSSLSDILSNTHVVCCPAESNKIKSGLKPDSSPTNPEPDTIIR